jgi:hypothetical protein
MACYRSGSPPCTFGPDSRLLRQLWDAERHQWQIPSAMAPVARAGRRIPGSATGLRQTSSSRRCPGLGGFPRTWSPRANGAHPTPGKRRCQYPICQQARNPQGGATPMASGVLGYARHALSSSRRCPGLGASLGHGPQVPTVRILGPENADVNTPFASRRATRMGGDAHGERRPRACQARLACVA